MNLEGTNSRGNSGSWKREKEQFLEWTRYRLDDTRAGILVWPLKKKPRIKGAGKSKEESAHRDGGGWAQ